MDTGISPWTELNRASDQPFFERNNSDHFPHFDSSEMSNDALALRELIGKLGSCSTAFPDESPNFAASTDNKLIFPVLDHRMSIANSAALAPTLPSLAADPGFAERAAKFSCFNGGTSRLGMNGNGESRVRSNSPLMGNDNLVLLGPEKKFNKFPGSNANSPNGESSVSEQIPSGETGSKLNSRKRKVVSRGKNKEDDGSNSAKGVGEGGTEIKIEIAKRSKTTKTSKIEDESRMDSNDENKNQKLPEPPKDYIHVRARRGQATDSHSLAERVRRGKISERMKLLQDLVPGCNKVTGKALMLDEIINYVQSLQRQVEFLSMKLSSVTPGLDFNVESLLSKDMFQQNANLPQQIYSLDPSSSPFYHHQQQNVQEPQHNSTNVDGFNETLSQFSSFSEDDLHSIVRMVGFPVHNQMKIEAMDDGRR